MSDGCAEVYFAKPVSPQKTWLDDCAFVVLAAIVSKYPYCFVDKPEDVGNADRLMAANARGAYRYAQAMLAEKQRIEKEETK